MKENCSVRVHPQGRWGDFHTYQCTKKAVVERNGKFYCKIHDPEYIKQKDEKRRLKREAEGCQKCHRDLKLWWNYCPSCGTKIV